MRNQNIDEPINDSGLTELHLGAYHQEFEWVKNCIDAGFDVNKKSNNGYTHLVWVISMYCTTRDTTQTKNIIDILVENGADPKYNPTSYDSLLEFAKEVHTDVHEYLLSKNIFN